MLEYKTISSTDIEDAMNKAAKKGWKFKAHLRSNKVKTYDYQYTIKYTVLMERHTSEH